MPFSSLALAVAAGTCLPWTPFASANPRAINMDFNKVKAPRTLMRRDGSVPVTIVNLKKLYLLDLEIGTPPQPFRLNLDTGSSDLFVPSITEDFCLLHQEDCQKTGVYDALKSYTHEDTKIPFSTSFGDNSAYNGTLFKDTVHIGGAILEKAQFGVSEKTANVVIGSNGVDAVGLIGVGFEANEAGVSDGRPTYPNIVSSLRASGAIAARAFSLYINSQGPYIPISIQSTDGDLTVTSLDAATGSIIFGGVDSSLYTGPLITVPMIKKGNETIQREFGVSCTSLTSSSSSDSKNDVKDLSNNTLPAYALLDSGGEASQVPPDMFSAIQQDFGAVAGPDGHYYVPCDRANSTATVTFGFGGPNGAKIVTPAGAFVKANDPSTPEECGPSHCCRLSVSPTSDGITLGDDFLHSAYLVFDIDNEVVALAQANLEPSTERNLREITAGVNGIPGAGSSSDSSTAVGTASGAPVSATGGSGGTMTATGTQPPIAGHTSAADRARGLGMETLMMGAAVGVGVGVGALMW